MPSPLAISRKFPFYRNGLWNERSHERGHARQSWFPWTRPGLLILWLLIGCVVLLLVFRRQPLGFNRERPAYIACGAVEDTSRSLAVLPANKRVVQVGTTNYIVDSGVSERSNNADEPVKDSRPKVLAFVGIQTGFGSAERRKALRQTWFPSSASDLARMERETGLVFRFVIGHTSDASLTAELENEIDIHRDVLRIDNEEEYSRLPFKTLTFFKAAYTLYDAEFYVKADDDIYLRPDRLAVLLKRSRPKSRTYLGCMKKGGVITNSAFKWYERLGYLLGNEYFYHAYGPIYALSRDVVADLSGFRNDSLRMFSNEDVTIGSWMLAFNVDHEDDRTLCQADCQVNSIAVWDIPQCSGLCHPEMKLLALHHQDMCSKSPTLPNG